MLLPHQERVVSERAELSDKLTKLATFLDGEIFHGLDYKEQTRLFKQRVVMEWYLSILDERIAAF